MGETTRGKLEKGLPSAREFSHVDNMSSISEVIEYAKTNGGVVTAEEAVAIGLPKSTLYRRVDDGVLVRVARGVLALPGTATRADISLRAASRTMGAVVSHQSAALVQGLKPISVQHPSVTVTHRGSNKIAGLTVHQSTDLLPSHVETVAGLPTTTAVRTAVDLAKVLKPQRLERVIDNALASSIVDLDHLIVMFMTLTRKGKRGMKALRSILEKRAGEPVFETSELEAHLLRLIELASLPPPVREFHAPWLKKIEGRVDLAYPRERVVIEADGRRWHTQFDAFETDRTRDNAAQLAGWVVLRFTWRMVHDEPTQVVSTIRRALDR